MAVRLSCAPTRIPTTTPFATLSPRERGATAECLRADPGDGASLPSTQVGQHTLAIDATKVLANASKHAAVSYAHAEQTMPLLDQEIEPLPATAAGRALSRLRQQTVEPVVGIITAAMGFRRLSLRGP